MTLKLSEEIKEIILKNFNLEEKGCWHSKEDITDWLLDQILSAIQARIPDEKEVYFEINDLKKIDENTIRIIPKTEPRLLSGQEKAIGFNSAVKQFEEQIQ